MCPVACASAPVGVDAVLPLKQSQAGGSGSFLVSASDGRDYWCKALNNFQSPSVPVNEQIVARWGGLVGVSVCAPELVRVDGIAGWEFRPGRIVEAGWAHGSVAVENAIETRSLDHRADDDNRRRHAGFYALQDWLCGADQQWLYSTSAENAYYSHDHGHFFPAGPDWVATNLGGYEVQASALPFDTAGLDADELRRLADAIEATTDNALEEEASKLPAAWPRSDQELDALVRLASARKRPCAERLRSLIP